MVIKVYIRNKNTGRRYRLNGVVPSGHLPKKRHLTQSFASYRMYNPRQLPPKVDLRPHMTGVENQSNIGSCAANCFAGAYEYLTKRITGRDIDVSRLFMYYNARVREQKSRKVTDTGCTLTGAIEALEEFGTCLESLWPYDTSRVNTRPSEQSYKEAQRHKITEALRLNVDLSEMKSCLAQGYPFAFGLRLYNSFDKAMARGVVPLPNTNDKGRTTHGCHALLAVGYSDKSQAFIVRNSWGTRWGDAGYCYIPYEYVANPDYAFDVWTVRAIASHDFGRGHWDLTDAINYTQIISMDRGRKSLNDAAGDDDDTGVIETVDEKDDDDDDDDDNEDNNKAEEKKEPLQRRASNQSLNHQLAKGGSNSPRFYNHNPHRQPLRGNAVGRNVRYPQHLVHGFQNINIRANIVNNPFNQSPVVPPRPRPNIQNLVHANPLNNRFNPRFQ